MNAKACLVVGTLLAGLAVAAGTFGAHLLPQLLEQRHGLTAQSSPVDFARAEKNFETGAESETGIESSNVLQFLTADGSKISARPSGTEPKIKFYFSVNEKLNSAEDFDKVDQQLTEKINAFISDLKLK